MTEMRWRRVVFADECPACPCCGEAWCAECGQHYADCLCPGPTQDDEYDYEVRADGHLYAREKDEE